MNAAVPHYVGKNYQQAPPGHCFRLYFAGWTNQWQLTQKGKQAIVQQATQLCPDAQDQLRWLLERQDCIAATLGDAVWTTSRYSQAPLATGLGQEHPLENGFAFLDPYGLPYLPGSSVKGVLRRAAEELALFESDHRGWTVPALWWLFGFDPTSSYLSLKKTSKGSQESAGEAQPWREAFRQSVSPDDFLFKALVSLLAPKKEATSPEPKKLEKALLGQDPELLNRVHWRGALEFWDVFPQPGAHGLLQVDIMNPHYGHYYQQGEPPHDCGNPNPIFFLAIAAGVKFHFFVRWAPPARWPQAVKDYFLQGKPPRWQALLSTAFDFAAQWLGFGAKTAVGYGRLAPDPPTPLKPTSPNSSPPKPPVSPSRPLDRPEGATHAAGVPPAPLATVSSPSPQEKLTQEVNTFLAGHHRKEKLQELLNQLARFYKEPWVPPLVEKLWRGVETNLYLRGLLEKHQILGPLIPRGGRQ